MEERAVVTCFLRHGVEVLLVRRSDAVGTYRGRWGGISGYAEGTPDEAARWEVDEEVGLLDATEFVRSAAPVVAEDEARGVRWLIHPYLFDCGATAVDPNEEIADHEWVQPPEILRRETVPKLWEAYAAVAPTVETVRDDDDHGSAYVSLRALEVLRDRAATAAIESTDRGDATEYEYEALAACARVLCDARPGMGVVANRVNRVMATADQTPESVLERAMAACEHAVVADLEAADRAVELLGQHVLTLSRSGTVADALCEARPDRVYIAESRPACEGVGVAEELADCGLEVRLFVDAAMGHVIDEEDVESVLVGADTVLADGSVVNKVGTRLAALAAVDADVDCYAVCSRDKIVPETTGELELELEAGPPEAVYDGDTPVRALNPTFESVDGDLFTGIVTEDGVLSDEDVETVAETHAGNARWDRTPT